MSDANDAPKSAEGSPRAAALARAIRAARGEMVQVKFAKLAQRPQSVISQWETGKSTPGLEPLFDLEQRLGLAAGTLALRAGYFTAEAIEGSGADPAVVGVRWFSSDDDAGRGWCLELVAGGAEPTDR
jgi:transcriptional regulator with XRE-family HTH domain